MVAARVHTAVGLLEDVSDCPLLFPASLTCAQRSCPAEFNAPKGHAITCDIGDFITWVNSTFSIPGGKPAIPPDPHGNIHGTRFRRTLAWFIVRQPRGLIAAALQYGHVSTKVTLSYAS